jgi:hypothetical protein
MLVYIHTYRYYVHIVCLHCTYCMLSFMYCMKCMHDVCNECVIIIQKFSGDGLYSGGAGLNSNMHKAYVRYIETAVI